MSVFKNTPIRWCGLLLGGLLLTALATAQMRVLKGDGVVISDHDPRDYLNSFSGFPSWEVDPAHRDDVFTFARLRYPSMGQNRDFGWRLGGLGRDRWRIDYPDSDLNMSFRLQQLTSLKVDPIPVVVDIDPAVLRHYPFLYMIEPGYIDLDDEQAKVLREYCLNGGFIMVDDFWGDQQWNGFERGLRQIFPDREWVELELDHEIFSCVFKLTEKPQVSAIGIAQMYRGSGITHEPRWNGAEEVHYRAILDDHKRICMVICWNTDLGDGWEREGEDEWYFREFAEKKAFPMGVNIIVYSMTH